MKTLKRFLLMIFFVCVMCGTLSVRAEAATPGMYNSSGKMIYTWKELTGDSVVKGGILKLNNGIVSVSDSYYLDEDTLEELPVSDYLYGKLVLNTNVKEICNLGSTNLTEVVIPESVKSIDDYAFSASELKQLNIPASVTSIGKSITSFCEDLAKITVASGNNYYSSGDNGNVIIEKKSNKLISGCKNSKIPKTVKVIAKSAFLGCTNLKSITIPSGVHTIEEMAFYECYSLKKVTIPKTVKKVGDDSFFCVPLLHNNSTLREGSKWWGAEKLHHQAESTCTICHDFIKSVTLSSAKFVYSGKTITPTVVVKDEDGKKLTKNKHYTVTYATGRKNVGRYKIVVKPLGEYIGSKTVYFVITPKAPANVNYKKVDNNKVKLSWSKSNGATGYRVYYKKSTASEYKILKTTTNRTYTTPKLQKGTTYKFKVVPYVTKNSTKYFSSAYKIKTIKF